MLIGTAQLTLYAPWVHSLKEKRMVVNSIIARVQNQFHVSVAEVDSQDIHQTIVIGVACVAGTAALADSVIDHVVNYIESCTEAEITNILREIR
nr:DUF503 domain-containing protein [uncultured Caproiciproducens sp.]